MGFVMMPIVAASYVSLERSAMAGATSATMIVRQVGGSIGSGLCAVVLAQQISGSVTGTAPDAAGAVPVTLLASGAGHARAALSPLLADAFGHTFLVPVGMLVVTLLPALFLPRATRREARAGNGGAPRVPADSAR